MSAIRVEKHDSGYKAWYVGMEPGLGALGYVTSDGISEPELRDYLVGEGVPEDRIREMFQRFRTEQKVVVIEF